MTRTRPRTAGQRMPVAARTAAALVVAASAWFAAASPAVAAGRVDSSASTASAAVVAVAPSADVTSAEAAFYALVNTARTKVGCRPYVSRRDLVAVARAQAARMASAEVLAHNPHLTSDVRGYRWVGENVGWGYDVTGLNKAFLASAHHRENILDADFTEVGIGVAIRGGRIWVAEVFRQPVSTTAYASASRARAATPLLAIGARGSAVRRLQRLLGDRVDATFGTRTRSRVVAFQKAHGLRVTGRADAATWRLLQGAAR